MNILSSPQATLPEVSAPDAIILSHQRSGTHLLQSILSSHPAVHGRGEFILQYRRLQRKTEVLLPAPAENQYIYSNKPSVLNLAIVMYSQADTFEQLCGPLAAQKVIHLLRDPVQVARSVCQMEADRRLYGQNFRAHFHTNEVLPAPAPLPELSLLELEDKIRKRQKEFTSLLLSHDNLLTLSYEEITNNAQTTELDKEIANRILTFLKLPFRPLSSTLRKQH